MSLDERTCALLLLALSIIVGVTSPPLANLLEPIALPALFVVVLCSLVPFARLPGRELVSINRNVLRVLFWQLLVLPALVMALVRTELNVDVRFKAPAPVVTLPRLRDEDALPVTELPVTSAS